MTRAWLLPLSTDCLSYALDILLPIGHAVSGSTTDSVIDAPSWAMEKAAYSKDIETLQRPRILCLHGGGTNARIFRAQCRALIHALAPYYRLCFAEAPLPSVPGPDVTSVYQDWGPFKAWMPLSAMGDCHYSDFQSIEDSLRQAMDDDDALGASGKWVGLLGFSQGAKISAALLYYQQRAPNFCASLFPDELRFAVLMAGRGPLVTFDPWSRQSAQRETHAELLSIPTLHIHGLQDEGLPLHRELMDVYCDQQTARLVEWDGDHRVPIKTADVKAVVQAILEIDRSQDSQTSRRIP